MQREERADALKVGVELVDTQSLGFLSAVDLALGAYLCFELCDGLQHVEQQTLCGVSC